MGSKGRIPPHHLRRPLPDPGLVHPDPFGPGNLPHPGPFPPFDVLPPPEILEQKIAAQHVEMQRLGSENQRIAATHGTLRQELAAAKHELQIFHAQIGAITSEREKQMRSLREKIDKMEAELKATELVKLELRKAHAEAQNLVFAREELMSKVHLLSQDLHRAHVDMQQLPALMAEFESLRQEYQHCRATFDYEKKFYNAHLESLQVMEKNYINMARELEKLRAELMNTTNVDNRIANTVGQYGSATGSNENGASGHPVGQNAYEVGYGIHMRRGPLPSAATGAGEGAAVYVGAQSGPTPTWTGYETSRGAGYDASIGTAYESHMVPSYDASIGTAYESHMVPSYDASIGTAYESHMVPSYDASIGTAYESHSVPGYDAQGGLSYDDQRGGANDASRNATFDAPARSLPPPYGQAAVPSNGPYESATAPAPAPAGGAYEAPLQAGNSVGR